MKFKIEWQGIEELKTTINNAHPKVVKQSIAVVKNNTEELKGYAMELAPYDTGFLKGSFITNYYGMTGEAIAQASYAGYQEYGTRYQPGKPFMRPAMWVVQPMFEKDLTDVMKGAFV